MGSRELEVLLGAPDDPNVFPTLTSMTLEPMEPEATRLVLRGADASFPALRQLSWTFMEFPEPEHLPRWDALESLRCHDAYSMKRFRPDHPPPALDSIFRPGSFANLVTLSLREYSPKHWDALLAFQSHLPRLRHLELSGGPWGRRWLTLFEQLWEDGLLVKLETLSLHIEGEPAEHHTTLLDELLRWALEPALPLHVRQYFFQPTLSQRVGAKRTVYRALKARGFEVRSSMPRGELDVLYDALIAEVLADERPDVLDLTEVVELPDL